MLFFLNHLFLVRGHLTNLDVNKPEVGNHLMFVCAVKSFVYSEKPFFAY